LSAARGLQLSWFANVILDLGSTLVGASYERDLYCDGSRELRVGHFARLRATKGQPTAPTACRPT
jgi:hypothetical protein